VIDGLFYGLVYAGAIAPGIFLSMFVDSFEVIALTA